MTETQTGQQPQTLPAPIAPQTPQQPDAAFLLDVTNAALLTRVLIGLALEGSDYLLERLGAMQQVIDEERQQGGLQTVEPENRGAQMRYLTIGLLLRSERAAFQAAQSGVSFAAQTTGWFFGALNSMTSHCFLRPLRQPFDQLIDRLVAEGQLSLAEGRIAEQDGRILGDQLINQIIDEFIEYISDNPALAKLVSDQIGQQGMTMTSTVVENARSVTVTGDNLIERLARRVLGRAPRSDLPPSPFMGKPQTMYSPEARYSDESHSGAE